MRLEELTEEQKIAYAFAIRDIERGCYKTLWVNRLKEEWPEMYNYALEKTKEEKGGER